MAEVCRVEGCDRPTIGTRGRSGCYCGPHLRRVSTYGSADDWDPIPLDFNLAPADPAKVAMLRDLHLHDRVGAWCAAKLTRTCTCNGPCRYARMTDRELYGLLRQFWPT